MKKLLLVLLLVVVFLLGFVLGWNWSKPQASQQIVTTDLILTSLHDQGFLVTQTYVFNQPITIENKEGSFIKDLLFGQTIDALANMEVNLGVDLKQVTESDVVIEGDTIEIALPPAEIFNTRLVGPINVKNQQGILKRLLDHDDGYNLALQKLTEQAELAANDLELVQKADEQAASEVSRLMGFLLENKTIHVTIKNQDVQPD